MTPEGAIKTKIKKYLKDTFPGSVIYFPIASKFSQSGASDILCCINGRFVALEVKTATGKVTPLQWLFIDQVKAAGGVAAVVRSVEDVKVVLANFV